MTDAKTRQLNAERLPWVKRVDPRPCEGIKWGTVALKDLYPWGPANDRQPPRGIQPKSRCKNTAYWHFTARPASHAKSGHYCWTHLVAAGVYADEVEMARTDAWFERNGYVDAQD
jgi:hypothetical protein